MIGLVVSFSVAGGFLGKLGWFGLELDGGQVYSCIHV